NIGHFIWIKILSRLLSSHLSRKCSKKYVCERCLHYFHTNEKLMRHDVDCARMNECSVVLPNENDKWLSFRNYNRKKRLPFVVYADLECILEKSRIDDERMSRFTYHHHKVYSIGYYVRCEFDETMSIYRYCRGANCIEWFVDELYQLAHRVKSIYVKNTHMNQFTTEQWKQFTDATHCHICEKPFEMEHILSFLDKSKLKIMRSIFFNLNAEEFYFLTRKGVFPYEYVNNYDKLDETSLPPREAFYSSLTDEDVSVDNYQHAIEVWQRFRINTLGEYSDLYLKTDVLLLADVFENFRDTCMEAYKLDPAYYYTLPGYTWDAMLKCTGVRFELLTDIDMVLFVERGVRAGLSQCSHRYACANNAYLSSYDPSQPSTYLMYFDVNNLYGWAMMEPLPYGQFQWIDNVDNFDVMSVSTESDVGYILKVDLACPQSLHDSHADLPFCPTRERPPGGKRYDKLLATLRNKER
ncbi:hypothetical protein ALC62_10502, partial [Cyphomyrmex costatus]